MVRHLRASLIAGPEVWPYLVGGASGLLALGLFSIGIGRAYGHDAAHTVGAFIATPSFSVALRHQQAFNNHVLFSVLDHGVYAITGSAREWSLRILPVVVGAVVVGVLAAEVTRRLTVLAGLVAGISLCGNTLVLREFREVRGYSLATLGVLCASIVLLRLPVGTVTDESAIARRRRLVVGYVAALGAALATHLCTVFVLPAHALVANRRGVSGRRLVPLWAAGAACAFPFQATGLVQALHRAPPRQFDLRLPAYFGAKMLGGPIAAGGVGIAVLVGIGVARDRRSVAAAGGWLGAVVALLWVLGPFGLGPRYFTWAVPAVAALVGLGVAAYPRLAPIVVAAVALQLVFTLPRYSRSDIADRAAAKVIVSTVREGTTCAIGETAWSLVGYVHTFATVTDAAALASCTTIVSTNESRRDRELATIACAVRPYREVLRATVPGIACGFDPLESKALRAG